LIESKMSAFHDISGNTHLRPLRECKLGFDPSPAYWKLQHR
jgi:hypothetical protein